MRTLFMGDIHGSVEAVEEALAQECPVIFVGDFLDSFTRTTQEHFRCLDLVLEAIEAGKARALKGNHELSYMVPRHRCSGWNVPTQQLMDDWYADSIQALFQDYIFVRSEWEGPRSELKPVLITHAGLDKMLFDAPHLLNDIPQILAEWVPDTDSPAHWIGRSRGGPNNVGGLWWNDFTREHTPIEGLVQIFGHTHGNKLGIKGDSHCIDYLPYEAGGKINPSDFFYYDV